MTQNRLKIENNHTVAVTLRELSEAVVNLTDASQHEAAEKVADIVVALANKSVLKDEGQVGDAQQAYQQAEDHGLGFASLIEAVTSKLGESTPPCDCGVCQPQSLKSALDQVEGGVDTGDLRIDSSGRVYANGQLVGYAVIRR